MYPLIIRAIFLVLVLIGLVSIGDSLQTFLHDLFKMEDIPAEGHWLSGVKAVLNPAAKWFAWFLRWMISIFVWMILRTFDKYIVLIIVSPILALASEAADEKLTGRKYPFSFSQLMKDILRGSLLAIRNLFIEYGLFFAGFLLGFIPVLGWILLIIYPFFLILVSWYYYGFSMLDYSCERNKMGVRQSSSFVWRNKGAACGIGCIYWLIFLIPFAGFIFAPIMGVVGATMAFNDIHAREEANSGKIVRPS